MPNSRPSSTTNKHSALPLVLAGVFLVVSAVASLCLGAAGLPLSKLWSALMSGPDEIFIVQQGNDSEGAQKTLREALTDNPAWAGLTAVKEGRVHYMDRKLYHFKPNNRWGIAYAELEALLYEK